MTTSSLSNSVNIISLMCVFCTKSVGCNKYLLPPDCARFETLQKIDSGNLNLHDHPFHRVGGTFPALPINAIVHFLAIVLTIVVPVAVEIGKRAMTKPETTT